LKWVHELVFSKVKAYKLIYSVKKIGKKKDPCKCRVIVLVQYLV
jgi:hypothetical protein